MNVSPVANETLERERRWMRPAGVAALVAVAALLAGSIIRGTALEGDSMSEQLLDAASGDSDGQLLLGAVVSALGFALFAFPLTFLFAAARERSERVLRPLIVLTLTGGLVIGAGQIAGHTAFLNAADDFAASEAQRESEQAEAPAQQEQAPAEQQDDTAAQEEDEEEDADDRARDAREDASGAGLAGILGSIGGFAFAIGLFYTAIWSMRVGLMTRFWGSLGMAAAVVSILLPPFFVILLVWFLALGLMLLGVWPGGRPPAWEAGVAVPWPKPGEPPQEPGGETLDGTGRERTEFPLPEGDGEPADAGEPGPPPRKRKRRQ